jgi:hypothetical protein
MGIKLRLRKKGNKLQKIRKAMHHLNGQSTQVGHFEEQGDHSTAEMPYTDLMRMHHFGVGGLKPRQVLTLLVFRNRKLQDPKFSSAMKTWGDGPYTIQNNNKLLDTFGQILAREEKSIFGKASPLMPPSAPFKEVGVMGPTAPLVDTGELKEAVRYKTSTNKNLKKVD